MAGKRDLKEEGRSGQRRNRGQETLGQRWHHRRNRGRRAEEKGGVGGGAFQECSPQECSGQAG